MTQLNWILKLLCFSDQPQNKSELDSKGNKVLSEYSLAKIYGNKIMKLTNFKLLLCIHKGTNNF